MDRPADRPAERASRAWRPELPRAAAPPIAWLLVLLLLFATALGMLVLVLLS